MGWAARTSVTMLMTPGLAAAAAALGDVVVTAEDPDWTACNSTTGFDRLMCNDTLLGGSDGGGNSSAAFNGSRAAEEPISDVILMVVTSVVLGLMILITVIGNVFVIAAILLERHLQNVANYLIVSLAVADLMVACLVMPLGAVYEISKGWILGPELCDMWTSSDVLCCTASILHLVAIAVDRYWAVTNIDYIHTRNSSRIGAMIVLVWGVALIVSLAPQFGWKDPGYLDRINLQQRCLVSQDVAYQIFATCSTFYVPLLVILVLYWKIFQTARKRIRHRVGKTPALNNCSTPPAKRKKKRKHEALERHSDVDDETRQNTTAFTITAPTTESAPDTPATAAPSNNVSPDKSSTNNGSASHQSHISDASRAEMVQQKEGSGKRKENPSTPATTTPAASSSSTGVATVEQERRDPLRERRDKKESMEAKRERKAAKTLAIITGAFVICWLPFFIMALLMPLCESCSINDYVASFFLWLGYFNSTLNPVIYTIFSPEFRQAFKRILCGSKSRSNYRPRKFR